MVAAAFVAATLVGTVALAVTNEAAPRTAAPSGTPTSRSAPTVTSVANAPAAPPRTATPPAAATGTADGLVRLASAAVSHPDSGVVLTLLGRHFGAINSHDYASWRATVIAKRAAEQPESGWLQDYRSTAVSSVTIDSIADNGPDQVLVSLSFVSTQAVEDAPADLPTTRICWQSNWTVANVAAGGRLATPARGSTRRQAC